MLACFAQKLLELEQLWFAIRLSIRICLQNVLEQILQRKPCAHIIPKGFIRPDAWIKLKQPLPWHATLHYAIWYHTAPYHTIPITIRHCTALTAPYQLPFTTQHYVNVMFEFGADADVAEAPLSRADLICKICCTGISWPNLVQPKRSPEICSSHINDVKLFSIVIAPHWEREEAILL